MTTSDLPKLSFDVDTSKMVESHCEYCRRKFWVDPDMSLVCHEMPFCAEFQVMEALEFVRSNNKIKLDKIPKA